MRIFGKTAGEYLRFAAGILSLAVLVGAARLVLSLAGAPVSVVKFVSVTAVILLGIVSYGVRTHTSGFGSCRELLPLMVLTAATASWISGVAVVLAIATGQDNIYSIPEYSGGGDGKTSFHAFAHFVLAPVIVGLIGWVLACLVMLGTKLATRRGQDVARQETPSR
jgi:hypothetical protein